jgi:ubiquinone/menaquinone biosynthesis C-methylase UbiE
VDSKWLGGNLVVDREENYKLYKQRINLYRQFGCDLEQERKFIIDKSCPIQGNILEVGTGRGYFTLALARDGYNFTSVDISPQMQEFTKSNLIYYGAAGKVNFVKDDITDLSFADNSFDTIFCINVLHHIEVPRLALEQLLRVSNRGAKLVLSDFNNNGFDLVNRIHHAQGREHHPHLGGLDLAISYLRGKGSYIDSFSTDFQDLVIARL